MKRRFSLKVVMAGALLFLAAFHRLDAQCYGASNSVNELGIRLGSVTNASSDGGMYIEDKMAHLGFLNGIHYKRYGNFGAFRTSLGLTRYEYESRRGCPDCIRVDGKVNNVKFRMGYELFGMMGPIEPFLAFDVVAAWGTYKGETFSTGSGTYYETTDIRSRRGLGFAPAAGLRVWLGYAISISAETSLEAMFYGNQTMLSQISPESQTRAFYSNRFASEWHPLNWLSLNVMF